MIKRISQGLFTTLILLLFITLNTNAQTTPGSQGYLLSNGWMITPTGKQIETDDMPMSIITEPQGIFAFVLTAGWNDHGVTVIDIGHNKKIQHISLKTTWQGLAFDANKNQLYASGGTRPIIERIAYDASKETAPLSLLEPIALDTAQVKKPYLTGLALNKTGDKLYVGDAHNQTIWVVDPIKGVQLSAIALDGVPYQPILSSNEKTLYVSLWDRGQVAVIDLATGKTKQTIKTGNHPNDLALSNDNRLFVANANDNSLSIIDLKTLRVRETIVTTLYPKSPQGSTPNGLALSPDGNTLLVANADNNNLAWVDITEPGASEIRGFIPTGWYPSAVTFSPDGSRIVVGNAKGGGSAPNPRGLQPNKPFYGWTPRSEFIGKVLTGTVSLIYTPQELELAKLTRQVYRNTPYADHLLERTKIKSPVPDIVPDSTGVPSQKIEYVLYIIKENRTYDQVLGDMPEGNGDTSLVLFGEKITPNHHALARDFVLLDNFYVDAEVSADGHSWSTAAYATDYTEKTWPAWYSRRGTMNDPEEKLYTPNSGFIWDLCKEAGISYRSYGEMITVKNGKIEGRFPGLVGHVHPTYKRARGTDYTDIERAKDWIAEFTQFEKEGRVPRFQMLSLPDDHTSGTQTGAFTPFVQMARNDQGLAMIVEAASKSSLWSKMAIFVVEDDAQNGPDHVDAHRTIAYVISPWSRLKKTDSTFYTTSSMLRTIELILGLPPMSQYDAAATPMFSCFTGSFSTTPYKALPANIDLTTLNTPDAYGAAISNSLQLADVDEIPDLLFSEIIWKAIKGANSEMPAPVRRARLVPLSSIAFDPNNESEKHGAQ